MGTTAAVREAWCALGAQLAGFRRAAGYSQAEFAAVLNFSRSTVANVETGRQHAPRCFWESADMALRAHGALTEGYDKIEAAIRGQHQQSARDLRVTVRQRAAAGQPAFPEPLRGTSYWLIPFGDSAQGHEDAAAIQAFRMADLQVGGKHLYASVLRYLQLDIAPRLFGASGDTEDRTIFTAAAAFTEMVGWMAHDAGADAAGKLHFEHSLALSKISGDRQLSAHVLGSLSHLAIHLNEPDAAIGYASQGWTVLRDAPPSPDQGARLLALAARGTAARQNPDRAECRRLLVRAEKALDTASAEPGSPWVSGFDAGALAAEAARCLYQLGDLIGARRQAERVITLRSPRRARSRALGQIMLAALLIEAGQPEEACAIAQDVIDATRALGSYFVIGQLSGLKPLLIRYRAVAVVAEFLGRMDEALTERRHLCQHPA